jgi:RNA polymerase sigma-70 factor (ECF subfamily)
LTTVIEVEDLVAEERRLAERAVAGDGDAFAELYGRYERRAYNLCLRIVGSEDDAADATQEAFVNVLKRLPKMEGRDLAFGSYLFTSARHACYDLIERRKRAEPSDMIAEGAITVGAGVGGGGVGFDPGDPDDDPERHVLLEARQEEIREANATLPERQREVLALREVEGLSYDEIAEIMDMNRNSVAQLISRARINLRDALRGTALGSIATSSEDCRRALAMLAATQDGEDAGDPLLDEHVSDCETCRLSREAMEEAGVSYRAWVPVAAAPLLFRETMAHAAEAVGADWSDAIARHEPRFARTSAGGGGAGAGGATGSARASGLRRRRLDLLLAAGLAAVLLLVVFSSALRDGTPVEKAAPVAEETPAAATEPALDEPKEPAKKQKKSADGKQDKAPQVAASDPDEPVSSDGSDEPDADGRPNSPASGGGSNPGHQGQAKQQERGGTETLSGDEPTATTPPVTEDPPPADPPTSDPPTSDPPAPTGCRDANGNPITCPPREPPVRCPDGCILIPPSREPPA